VVYSGRAVSLRLGAVLTEVATPFVMSLALCGLLAVVGFAVSTGPELARLALLAAAAIAIYVAELMVVKPVGWRQLRAAITDLRTKPAGLVV
jgi:hypothetical protein